ncbi:MAG: xylulokinase [Rhodothermales bacterium]|jgi:xylulokinase
MRYTLGLDVSTTATKALLLSADGTVAGVASSPHRLKTPQPLWSEQDPLEWWEAARTAIGTVLRETGVSGSSIAAIGLSGQMHGLVILDGHGDVLRPSILWNDQRSAVECDEIRATVGLERLVAMTGNDAFPGFTAPKILWVRKHEPEIYGRIRHVLLPKDYIRYRLSGDYATDKAGAGGTLLLDLRTRDWSDELLGALDIPREWLPKTHEGPEITGILSAVAASETGLPAGIPIVGGGGDQAAQAVGVGAVSPDIFALTVGTSGVVFAPCDGPTVDPKGRAHAFPHAVPGQWHVMGVILSAAGSLQWYRDTMAPDVAFEDLVAEAASVPPGAEDLLFLPYLSGERTPHADPRARGAFVGLTLSHGRGHMTRAVLEGVAFGLKDNLTLLREAGLPVPAEIRASGGAMKSDTWSRILADVLDVDLVTVDATEGAAVGAAILAGVGAGLWSSVQTACKAAVRTGRLIRPDPGVAASYAQPYEHYRNLYPALRAHFDSLGADL